MMRPYNAPKSAQPRFDLVDDLDGIVKRLRQLMGTLKDWEDESMGLVTARLGEVNERLSTVCQNTQDALAAGLVTVGGDSEDDDEGDEGDEGDD
jgi:hypothetical protein